MSNEAYIQYVGVSFTAYELHTIPTLALAMWLFVPIYFVSSIMISLLRFTNLVIASGESG